MLMILRRIVELLLDDRFVDENLMVLGVCVFSEIPILHCKGKERVIRNCYTDLKLL